MGRGLLVYSSLSPGDDKLIAVEGPACCIVLISVSSSLESHMIAWDTNFLLVLRF